MQQDNDLIKKNFVKYSVINMKNRKKYNVLIKIKGK